MRMYHNINPPEYNEETIRLINDDLHCQIIISTVAFSNGLNAKSLLDSLSLGFASTFDESWQEKGRVGQNPDTTGRGIISANLHTMKAAEAYLECEYHPRYPCVCCHPCSVLAASLIQRHSNNLSKSKSKTPQILDKTKVLVIVEKTQKRCYISRINLCYGNPSLDPSKPDLPHLDCITAGHHLPCSLCLSWQGSNTIALSLLSPEGVFPILTPPKSAVVSKL